MLRRCRVCFVAILMLAIFAPPEPAAAQDVLVLPNDDPPSEPDKSGGADYLNYLTPSPPKQGKNKTGNRPQTSKERSAAPMPYNLPKIGSKKGTGKELKLPSEAEQAGIEAVGDLNAVLLKMKELPTKVVQQPEYSPDKGRRFSNNVTLFVKKYAIDKEDLGKAAAGTNLEPDEFLKLCEPRFMGAVAGEDNSGVDFEVRGSEGVGTAGYEKTLTSIQAVLALACKLPAPPRNRGTIPRMGKHYLLGVAQGGCYPPRSISGGSARIGLVYEGKGLITCEFD